MRRVLAVHTLWPAPERHGSVTLAFDQRHRRRVVMTDDAGAEFLLDLPSAAHLRDGDGLELEGGGFLQVIAAAEPVAEVTCGGAAALARVAWHVGNRHVPVQILDGGTLLVPDDHVLIAMLEGLGAGVTRVTRPFQPETGAYDRGGHHHHH